MKLKILHFSLLFVATTAKNVYVEGATTDSPGAEAVVPAAKLDVNESVNYEYYEYVEDAAIDSLGGAAVDPAAELGVNESANSDAEAIAGCESVKAALVQARTDTELEHNEAKLAKAAYKKSNAITKALMQWAIQVKKIDDTEVAAVISMASAPEFEDEATDSPGGAAVDPAVKLGVNKSANYEYVEYVEYVEDGATDSPGAEAVDPAAKLGVNESANHRRMAYSDVGTLTGRTYAGCEGTYVQDPNEALTKRFIWPTWVAASGPAYSHGRFMYWCGSKWQGSWHVGSSDVRAAYLRGEHPNDCWYFIKSAKTGPIGSQEWWKADWSANDGAISMEGSLTWC